MSKANEANPRSGTIDTEVELNALELHQLSLPEIHQSAVPARVNAAEGNATAKRLSLCLGFLLAVAGGGGIYAHISQRQVQEPVRPTSSLAAIQPEPEEAEPEPQPVAPPVRFTNPFDKTEVFEFPAGTSREEARAAVAQILLERGAERHAKAHQKKHH